MRSKKRNRSIISLLLVLSCFSLSFAQTYPETKEFKQNLGLYQKKSYKQALQGFKSFLEKYPSSLYLPEVYFYLAMMETNYYTAVITYQRIIEKFPLHEKTGEALYRLGKLYLLHNNYSETIRTYKKLIDNHKKSNFIYGAHYYLGLAHLIKSDYSESLQYFDYIIGEGKKDKFHILSLIGKANCYFDKKDYNKSIYYFRETLKIKNKNYYPSIYYGLGICYFKLRKYDKAYYYFRKVKNEFPGSSEYELATEKILFIKDNKTIFDSIDWSKFKAEEWPEKKKQEKEYFIQVASVKNKRYANDWRIKLRTSGYTARFQTVKTDKGTFYRTLIGPYPKKEDAEKIKKDIERKFKLTCRVVVHK